MRKTVALFLLWVPLLCAAGKYEDGRPEASFRLEAEDYGVVMRHGGGPGDCDHSLRKRISRCMAKQPIHMATAITTCWK